MIFQIRQFIARQLNDHDDSPSGVEQPIYYEWTSQHITDALYLAVQYLYSIIPQNFTDLKKKTITSSDCVVSFCEDCSKFITIINVETLEKGCIQVVHKDYESNDMSSLLDIGCNIPNDNDLSNLTWELVDGATCIIKFNQPLPQGTVINYLCATPMADVDDFLLDKKNSEYLPLITDYALWWLYRTDSESRSNLERAKLHYTGVKEFVTQKLEIEFSLKEDDYNYGRRKVDDD